MNTMALSYLFIRVITVKLLPLLKQSVFSCKTYFYTKLKCMLMKHANCLENMHVCANQNALVQYRCTHALCANHDVHSGRLMCHVYTHAVDMYTMSPTFCEHTACVASIFKNVLSCIIAAHVCSQV